MADNFEIRPLGLSVTLTVSEEAFQRMMNALTDCEDIDGRSEEYQLFVAISQALRD